MDIRKAAVASKVLLYPGESFCIDTDIDFPPECHPLTLDIKAVDGKIQILLVNAHKHRILKLPENYKVHKLLMKGEDI